ncbi:MAG: Xaa-Pro peptidase family protein [Candidatus Zixiibacteriota bacterium]
MNILKEKIGQVAAILRGQAVDVWLVYCRESDVMADPVMPLVVGHSVVWPSYFIYTAAGDAIAIVGEFDSADFERSGCFTEVHPFSNNAKECLQEVLRRLDPAQIAINYSRHTPTADGLTYGMYLNLCNELKGTPYAERLISSESICISLRSRKSPGELQLLKRAADIAGTAWDNALPRFKAGMTEMAVARILEAEMKKLGAEPSFQTIANAGAKTQPGHGKPTDAVLEPGDLLHVDFGANVEGYCSDIQRLAYVAKPGETTAPDEVKKAFNLVRDIIIASGKMLKPDTTGFEIDSAARKALIDNGYPEYRHALGHQLGQYVHDGGALLGPRWPQYGILPDIPLEENIVVTIELEIKIEGVGCAGLEEDARVTPDGAEFLSTPQTELPVINVM